MKKAHITTVFVFSEIGSGQVAHLYYNLVSMSPNVLLSTIQQAVDMSGDPNNYLEFFQELVSGLGQLGFTLADCREFIHDGKSFYHFTFQMSTYPE